MRVRKTLRSPQVCEHASARSGLYSFSAFKPAKRLNAEVYWGISSMVKASMMSPSLMSLNFSMDRPHS